MNIVNEIDKAIQSEILNGLLKEQKVIPSKYFYDEKGSLLFDKICKLDEYYPTRTEMIIMKNNIKDIISLFDKNTLLVELGSGSSLKTRILLSNIKNLKGYIPIDISEDHLVKSVENITERYPNLNVYPVVGDYTKEIEFPDVFKSSKKKIAFFPGSTIGNFTKQQAKYFLRIIADAFGKDSGLLIGIDRIKSKSVLEAAYNDSKGVTAAFNLNILDHINYILQTDFEINNFYHKAVYNEVENRIEMYLFTKKDCYVNIGEHNIKLTEGEKILTEYSHKYSIDSFKELLDDRYQLVNVWSDENAYFSVLYLRTK